MTSNEREHWVILVLTILLLICALLNLGARPVLPVSQFGPYEDTIGGPRSTTIWDWLELLIVPAALGIGAVWFNWVQKEAENERSEARQRQQTLLAYFESMTSLVLDNGLLESTLDSPPSSIARALTITTLPTLDGNQKGQVLRFLYDAHLINKAEPRVDLENADFSEAILSWAILTDAELKKIRLTDAVLLGANLYGANLQGADLRGANLRNVLYGKETVWINASYSGETGFPEDFDPALVKMSSTERP